MMYREYSIDFKGVFMDSNCAFISNDDGFTIFKYDKYTIRFKAPYSLERYTDIV